MWIAACGRDFDRLFVDGPSDAGDGVTGDGSTTGIPDSNIADDSSTRPDTGMPCAPSCDNASSCDAGTGMCTTLCSGCCNCGQQLCPASDPNKRCEARCAAGATCDVGCAVSGPCKLTCDGCVSAAFDCKTTAQSCSSSCTAGSTCEQTCAGGAPCTMTCAAGAACKLACSPTSATCELTCADGTKEDCGGRVFTCGRQCP